MPTEKQKHDLYVLSLLGIEIEKLVKKSGFELISPEGGDEYLLGVRNQNGSYAVVFRSEEKR